MTARMNRRTYGLLGKRLGESRFDEVRDERDERGRRWRLDGLLRCVIGGMLAGAQSLADVERISARMSAPMRRLLGIDRRVPDTTLRDALCTMQPDGCRKPLHTLVKAAQRRKALEPADFPFGVASLDGKHSRLPSCDDWYAQRQTKTETGALEGMIRTVTTTLTSHPARPVIDVFPIPAHTNEMGVFEAALNSLCDTYSGLFELVCYDAGACSAHNAAVVRERGLHYLFALTANQPTLLEEATRWLGSRVPGQADASSEDVDGGNIVIRRLYLGEATADPGEWKGPRTVLRIQTEIRGPRGSEFSDRYFISSLPSCRLSKEHWLLVVRRRWGVETAHQILDTAFAEDDHPWIEANPRGALVIAILRRIAYTLLTLFRSVTQRSDERRRVPWKELMSDILFALVTTTNEQLANLRPRRVVQLR